MTEVHLPLRICSERSRICLDPENMAPSLDLCLSICIPIADLLGQLLTVSNATNSDVVLDSVALESECLSGATIVEPSLDGSALWSEFPTEERPIESLSSPGKRNKVQAPTLEEKTMESADCNDGNLSLAAANGRLADDYIESAQPLDDSERVRDGLPPSMHPVLESPVAPMRMSAVPELVEIFTVTLRAIEKGAFGLDLVSFVGGHSMEILDVQPEGAVHAFNTIGGRTIKPGYFVLSANSARAPRDMFHEIDNSHTVKFTIGVPFDSDNTSLSVPSSQEAVDILLHEIETYGGMLHVPTDLGCLYVKMPGIRETINRKGGPRSFCSIHPELECYTKDKNCYITSQKSYASDMDVKVSELVEECEFPAPSQRDTQGKRSFDESGETNCTSSHSTENAVPFVCNACGWRYDRLMYYCNKCGSDSIYDERILAVDLESTQDDHPNEITKPVEISVGIAAFNSGQKTEGESRLGPKTERKKRLHERKKNLMQLQKDCAKDSMKDAEVVVGSERSEKQAMELQDSQNRIDGISARIRNAQKGIDGGVKADDKRGSHKTKAVPKAKTQTQASTKATPNQSAKGDGKLLARDDPAPAPIGSVPAENGKLLASTPIGSVPVEKLVKGEQKFRTAIYAALENGPVKLVTMAGQFAKDYNILFHDGRRVNNGSWTAYLNKLPGIEVKSDASGRYKPTSLVHYQKTPSSVWRDDRKFGASSIFSHATEDDRKVYGNGNKWYKKKDQGKNGPRHVA